jgi:polyketide biosynthesis enoyl-CoA hydratase PksI
VSTRTQIRKGASGIVELFLDDAENENRLSPELCDELRTALKELARDPSVSVLVLAGRSNVFSAGATLDVLRKLCTDGSLEDLSIPTEMLNFPVPIIAALEGHAVGGGLVLALCSDMVVASESSRYGFNFSTMGFTPGMGTTALLPSLVGSAFAAEMLLTGKFYKGRELTGRGIFNHVVAKERVLPLVRDLAKCIALKPRPVLEMIKDALTTSRRVGLQDALSRERMMHKASFGDPDAWNRIKRNYLGGERDSDA